MTSCTRTKVWVRFCYPCTISIQPPTLSNRSGKVLGPKGQVEHLRYRERESNEQERYQPPAIASSRFRADQSVREFPSVCQSTQDQKAPSALSDPENGKVGPAVLRERLASFFAGRHNCPELQIPL